METEFERDFESILAESAYERGLSLAAQSQRGQDGLSAFREAFELEPSNPIYGLDYALALHQAGEEELARVAAAVAVQDIQSGWLEDADAFTIHRVGLVYSMVLEDEHAALGCFAEAHSRQPHPQLIVSHAISLDRCGQGAEAAALAERAVDFFFAFQEDGLSRDEAHLLAQLAQVMSAVDDQEYGKAYQTAQMALESAPDHPAVHRIAGVILSKSGEFEEAAKHMRKAIDLVPDHALAWAGYQHALFGMGMFEESLEVGKQIEQVWPDIEEIRFNNASALLNMGRHKACEQELFDRLSDVPDDPYAHIGLGLSYASQGKETDARKEQATAIELAPDDQQIKRLSKQIDELLDGGGGEENENLVPMGFILLAVVVERMRRSRRRFGK